MSMVMAPARRLPPPDPETCQLYEQPARRGGPRTFILRDGRRKVGHYNRTKRMLYKHLNRGGHIYGNKPGIAWNLELLCRADNWTSRPKELVVIRHDLTKAEAERKPYRIPWSVAVAFAQAALDHDERFRVADDIDDQVLIPWPAWAGYWTEPPPIPEEVEEEEPAQPTLLDLPPDPEPVSFKHPI